MKKLGVHHATDDLTVQRVRGASRQCTCALHTGALHVEGYPDGAPPREATTRRAHWKQEGQEALACAVQAGMV